MFSLQFAQQWRSLACWRAFLGDYLRPGNAHGIGWQTHMKADRAGLLRLGVDLNSPAAGSKRF
jgi:hypothetical protein